MAENIGLAFVIITLVLIIGAAAVFLRVGLGIDPSIFSSMRVQ